MNWFMETAWANFVFAAKVTFGLFRLMFQGIGWLFSLMLNRRQETPPRQQQADMFDQR